MVDPAKIELKMFCDVLIKDQKLNVQKRCTHLHFVY